VIGTLILTLTIKIVYISFNLEHIYLRKEFIRRVYVSLKCFELTLLFENFTKHDYTLLNSSFSKI